MPRTQEESSCQLPIDEVYVFLSTRQISQATVSSTSAVVVHDMPIPSGPALSASCRSEMKAARCGHLPALRSS